MGCGASGSGEAYNPPPAGLPAETRHLADEPPTNERGQVVAAVGQLLGAVRSASEHVDMGTVLKQVAALHAMVTAADCGLQPQASSGGEAAEAAPAEAPIISGGAPTREQIKDIARQIQANSQQRDESKAEAFIERFAVSSILRGATFVGHINTDLDSVAGAISAANLYQGTAAKAQEELNGEIIYALKFAGLPEPTLFTDLSEVERSRVCLVDHNEEKQMVEDLRSDPSRASRIVGLIDHHA